jgi:hypothetical protein
MRKERKIWVEEGGDLYVAGSIFVWKILESR